MTKVQESFIETTLLRLSFVGNVSASFYIKNLDHLPLMIKNVKTLTISF